MHWQHSISIARSLSRRRCSRSPLASLLSRHNHTQGSQNANGPRTTHFGFQTVPEDQKEDMVKGVFDSVASSYDLMNDAMSMGVHRLWKDDFVSSLKPGRKGPIRCIDLAGGTGDIALRILDHAREQYADRETTVDVVDINAEMLKEGYRRFKKTMYHNSTSVPLVACLHCLTMTQRPRYPSLSQTRKPCLKKRSPRILTTCTLLLLVSETAPPFQMF